ncbi:hypothetical protein K7X08_037991 [Anisodus acutangulus]|uniref:Uncharacterized protein n=1 Tax=Anisodus acutangulus TaxID=402998 RepID=A0A9Q1RSP6_9SOLA|nr:hypothetical protein K7X08_037991 [Anisodus acutangulus]
MMLKVCDLTSFSFGAGIVFYVDIGYYTELQVAFYSLLVYFATSMGTQTVAAHQVMVQLFMICAHQFHWLFPKIFSPDSQVIREMHKVLLPYFLALCVTPNILSLEGTLLAGRDLKFISISMSSIFVLASLLLMLLSSKGLGLYSNG